MNKNFKPVKMYINVLSSDKMANIRAEVNDKHLSSPFSKMAFIRLNQGRIKG